LPTSVVLEDPCPFLVRVTIGIKNKIGPEHGYIEISSPHTLISCTQKLVFKIPSSIDINFTHITTRGGTLLNT
jgi:hypothetical protein